MIVGIVLAAGLGRRIGTPKALLRLAEETFHERAIRALSEAGLDSIVVVNEEVNRLLPEPRPGETRVLNPNPDQPEGMFASVRLGVRHALDRAASAALVLPVDHPRVSVDDIRRVVSGLHANASIVIPTHQGRRGHPIGLSRVVLEEVTTSAAIQTLRDVVHKDRRRVVEVEASEGVIRGINTPEDLSWASSAGFR